MGQLTDKIERAEKGAVQPLGFGSSSKREKIAPLLLLGAVDAGDAAQAKTVAASGIDGAIVLGTGSAKKADITKSVKALQGLTFGVWVDEGEAKDAEGTDFQVFSSDATYIGSLTGEERTIVMQVTPELDDSLLRTIDLLPVDGFLVSLTDAKSLSISQLMRLGRVRALTSRWLLVHLPALPTKEEAEQLRDFDVAAVVVSVTGRTRDEFQATQAMLRELPRESPKQRDRERSSATVPQPRSPGVRPASPPEPDDDDDDWDDE